MRKSLQTHGTCAILCVRRIWGCRRRSLHQKGLRTGRIKYPPFHPFIEEVFPMIATTWRKQAACRGLDVEAFYPVTEDEADAAEAKAVCAVCPVRQACLEHALAHREREGIWGGTTERERRRIVRQRRKSA